MSVRLRGSWKLNLRVREYKALYWCSFDVEPPSQTVAQHQNYISTATRGCWEGLNNGPHPADARRRKYLSSSEAMTDTLPVMIGDQVPAESGGRSWWPAVRGRPPGSPARPGDTPLPDRTSRAPPGEVARARYWFITGRAARNAVRPPASFWATPPHTLIRLRIPLYPQALNKYIQAWR